jgi:hypothetical protein
MAENNPYAPPRAPVDDVPELVPEGGFMADGRGVAAGNGWRWIADAWRFTSGQRLVFLGVIFLLSIVQLTLNFVPILGPIATTFVFPFLVAGLALGCDAVRRGQQLEVGHLFMGFQRRYVNKLLLAGVVSFAMSIVLALAMVMVLGLTVGMALFASGQPPTPEQIAEYLLPILLAILVALGLSVPMTMALLFVPTLVVLNDVDVMPAVRMSFVACLKNVVPFLIWGVIGLVMLIVATPLFLIGWFLVGSLLMVSLYTSYRDIFYAD